MMKDHRSKRKAESSLVYSSSPRTSTSHCDPHCSPDASPTQGSEPKRNFDNGNPPLVLLTNVDKMVEETKKKMMLNLSRKYRENWHAEPVKNTSSDESDSPEDLDKSLSNIAEIFESNIAEFMDFDNEDQEEFGHMEEASDMESSKSDSNFYQNMKKKLSSQIRPPYKKRKLNGVKDNGPKVISLKSKNSAILLMDHPGSAALHEYVSIEVLSGCVSVCGYEIKSGMDPIKVYSSKTTGLIEVKTESHDELWMRTRSLKKLFYQLHKVTGSKEKARKILLEFGKTTVVVLITACAFPPNLQFLELYYPEVFNFKLTPNFIHKVYRESEEHKINLKKKFFCLPPNKSTVQFNPDIDDLAISIMTTIRNSKVSMLPEGPRILVFGPKNSGKSSLMRYLMNKVLTMFPLSYYLDTDPGQTEFTPPGVVSLTEVTKPVIGPSFCHQRKPHLMCFTGGVSAEMSPDMYCKSVAKLSFLYMEHFSHEPLFVNTMGWIKGIGLECLKNVTAYVNPTIIIEMISDDEDCMFDYRPFLTDKTKFYQIRSPFSAREEKTDKCPASKTRELALLSYFGRCQPSYERPNYLNSFKPYCVSWDKIPIYIFGKKIVPYRLIESLNASVVALCTVDKSLIMESTVENLPMTLEDEPENDCVGFGIIRAIDEVKHLLYIVTPVPFHEMKNVNAIMKGNITVPKSVFLEQPIMDVPLPFTDEREIESEPETYFIDEDEAPVEDNKVPDEYRKSVKKRCRTRKRKITNVSTISITK